MVTTRKGKLKLYPLKIVMRNNLTRSLLFKFDFQPEKPLVNFFDGIRIHKDPYGVALVIGAWNYPLQLTMIPVQNAIAAGNCVIIKPSEIATASAQFLADYIPKYLDSVSQLSVRLCWNYLMNN